MGYKRRNKKEKECPACGQKFYGYSNQKFCIPAHSRIFWKYGHVSNTPKALKYYEENWNRQIQLLKQKNL